MTGTGLILVAVAIAVGLAGILVPLLPGTLLVWAAIAVWSVMTDTTASWVVLGVVTVLLGAGVHVVEHLTNLQALPPRGARFTAAPPAVEGFGTFPVRAFAEL